MSPGLSVGNKECMICCDRLISGDNWILECTDSDEFWSRDDHVRFKHKDTSK